MPFLVFAFIVVPIVELYVMVQVGQEIGALPTIAVLIVISLVGAWLVKREGMGVWRRIKQQVDAGKVPGADLLDAFLILFAGVLLLMPGFVTDAFGIILLLPPVRALIRRTLHRRFLRRVEVVRGIAARRPRPDIDI